MSKIELSPPMKALDMTNGEFFQVVELSHFLEWMRRQSAPVPIDLLERDTLVAGYIRHVRREQATQIKRKRRTK